MKMEKSYPLNILVYKKHKAQSAIIGNPIIINMLFLRPLGESLGGKTTLNVYEIGAPAANN